jgi:hypothetical protein
MDEQTLYLEHPRQTHDGLEKCDTKRVTLLGDRFGMDVQTCGAGADGDGRIKFDSR